MRGNSKASPRALIGLIAAVSTGVCHCASSSAEGGNGRSGGSPQDSSTGASDGTPGSSTLSDARASDASANGLGDATIDAHADADVAAGFSMTVKPVPVGGASTTTDSAASGGRSIFLGATGQGAQAAGLPAASKLAIRYASLSVGTIGLSVNGQTAREVNVHSTGALTGSYIYAIIDISIPADATLTIRRGASDVAIDVDDIIVGIGTLGLPHRHLELVAVHTRLRSICRGLERAGSGVLHARVVA